MFEKYCVNDSYTIKEVIDQLEINHDRVVIVLNDSLKVIGVISQGDIIRALSSGMDIHAQIKPIIRDSFFHLYRKDMTEAYKIFRKTAITLLPILDKNNKLIDIITTMNIYEYLER